MMLTQKIKDRKARIGVIGLGYVGLPLVIRFCEERFRVIGFDIDPVKVKKLNLGESYIKHIQPERLKEIINKKAFEATSDYRRLKDVDCIIICVPTPLKKNKDPDLSYVKMTSDEIARHLRK
ncbi:MAG: NAD(P)-binding domain-containing protein, partial [Thermodesulfovibrionales bacterium]